ncbi:hypothetical protein T492DRAFT_883276 [Pavlovales sp. CCMP2436]|nr:hypothetical protein T492DRAFT_883276 [Pavlovales sp. CCMP2436]|mmetsp:Transcript_35063/g.87425  ORF Transcript_35063/g.87425 Transcript_35063/m.87425 type:complete len:81 (-) Transcript_35063:510-752(-)|eukprot:CAMPEP_0180013300 /NCGR_PEP_ID=MMETSP0984-20121128/17437_1 /TAXON_ID=483367 /ORGANISM="non described non described, Strain CCMP 2436" /LENGTH=80 /DNA_ID=CAMNT_0021935633 /DNA_START=110 /DNA_END=352 /DNA_ORIENTATION=+
MGKRGQDQAKPPMKEPPMTRYRDKLGASEKHRTKLDTKDKLREVAHEQKGDETSRGFVFGAVVALLCALLLALGVNWLLM